MKLKKKVPLIDQTDKLGFWGGKFGGSFCAETLKKPIEDLETLFNKLKDNKNFIKERDRYFEDWINRPEYSKWINRALKKEGPGYQNFGPLK